MPYHSLSTTVKFQRLHDDARLPERQSENASGMDIYAYLPEGGIRIAPGERKLVGTGFAMEIEPGYEAQVRPRSGMATKDGITIINTPGTIDSDYRGEVKVGLVNLSNTMYLLEPGTRIAQLVLSAVPRVFVMEVETLSPTKRGAGGFGSTGAA